MKEGQINEKISNFNEENVKIWFSWVKICKTVLHSYIVDVWKII